MNFKHTKTMKLKSIATIVAAIALLPTAAFTQPNPPPPPPPPGTPPTGPVGPGGDRERKEKKVPVTYLGVETSDVPRVVSEQLGLPKGFGLVVDYVVPDGPAAAAGVQQNDILKMLNDQILTEPDQLSKLIRSFSEGTTITLTVLRKGKEEKIGVKLSKKEVSERSDMSRGHHPHFNFNFNGHDWSDFGMNDVKDTMDQLKDQLGDQTQGIVHDAVMTAQAEAQRALDEAQHRRDMAQHQRDMAQQQRERAQEVRDEVRRARDEARRAAGINVTQNQNGSLSTTKVDIGKAQIVYSDDKGELRVEKVDGKKVLTAKDPQGLLQFSGPVETKEELDKVPAEVRQRYEKLQNNDLPAVISEHQSEMDNDNDADDEDNNNDGADIQSMNQVCTKPAGQAVNYTFVKI
jgi:serine protease Do